VEVAARVPPESLLRRRGGEESDLKEFATAYFAVILCNFYVPCRGCLVVEGKGKILSKTTRK
jgi:hypothetical protein